MTDKHDHDGTSRVMAMFEEGRKLMADLLVENEKLRTQNAQLRNEKRDLETRVGKSDATSLQQRAERLEEELEELRAENAELKAQFYSVEEENRAFADRYLKVERQNADLTNLYVASYRLHSTLDYRGVIQIIKEIVINMIGSESFGIYLVNDTRERLVLVDHEGLDTRAVESVRMGEGLLGSCAQSGTTYVTPEASTYHVHGEEPVVCIPLGAAGQTVGVIGIYRLLIQKRELNPVDFDLFALLGEQATIALLAAKAFSKPSV